MICYTGNVNCAYWIGGTEFPASASPFHWINGEPLNTDLWVSGEPNYHVRGDKACVYTYRDQVKFSDASCKNRNGYTCEKGGF